MILFSSFSHIYIFLMFIYLGVLSGLVFFSVYSFTNKIKNYNFKIDKKILSYRKDKSKKKLKQKSVALIKSSKDRSSKKSKNKKSPNKKILEKIKNLTKRFLTYLKMFFNKFKKIFLRALNIVALCVVVSFSYYVNFVFNMGHLRLFYVVIWLLSFIFSYSLAKKVAKIFLNFYNYLKNKQQNK